MKLQLQVNLHPDLALRHFVDSVYKMVKILLAWPQIWTSARPCEGGWGNPLRFGKRPYLESLRLSLGKTL